MSNKRYYKAKAAEWSLGETSQGNPQVVVLFNILDEGAQETRLTWYGYFTEKTTDKTIESLRICGWQGEDLTDLTGLDTNEVSLVVEDEEYTDEQSGQVSTRARVRWVNKAGGLSVKQPLTGEKAQAFAASMRAAVRAFDAASGKRTTTAPKPAVSPSLLAPEPPPLTDKDIPF